MGVTRSIHFIFQFKYDRYDGQKCVKADITHLKSIVPITLPA